MAICLFVGAQENPVQFQENIEEQSNSPIFGLGLSVSSFGPGTFLTYHYSDYLKFKANVSYFNYNYSLNELVDDLQGTTKFRVGGLGIYSEFSLLKFLYLSGGVTTNFTSIGAKGKMAESVMIGDIEMTPDDIGELDVKITPSWLLCPYVGFGLERRLNASRRMGYSLEIGTYFQGSPDVEMEATGMLEPTASEEQEMIIENNIKPIDFWPRIAINLTYKL